MTASWGAPAWPLAAALVLLSALVAAGWRRYALRRQLLDLPDARRSHQLPTPRGGGVAVALVLLVGSPWLGPHAGWVALGLAITAGGGLLDDLRPLPAWKKLALQCLGALPLAWAFPVLPDMLGAAVGGLLAWAIVLVAVNFWNFMDGSNGMAASQALLAGLAVAGLVGFGTPAGWLGAMLVAACLGFLPFNVPRARLFLGDVGSHALGYAVAAMGLMALASGQLGPWTLLLLPSAFLLDAGCTLLWRLWRRQRVWLAHREHLYQRAIAHGSSHMAVFWAYAAWTGAAAALAGATAGAPGGRQFAILTAAVVVGVGVYWRIGRRWPAPDASAGMESLE